MSKLTKITLDHESANLRPVDPTAPSDREWREWLEANTISGAEWARYARN